MSDNGSTTENRFSKEHAQIKSHNYKNNFDCEQDKVQRTARWDEGSSYMGVMIKDVLKPLRMILSLITP